MRLQRRVRDEGRAELDRPGEPRRDPVCVHYHLPAAAVSAADSASAAREEAGRHGDGGSGQSERDTQAALNGPL
jgi:hypothetical protein